MNKNKIKNLKRDLLNTISYNINYPLQKPETVSFLITHRCCLNCEMCDSPKRSLKNQKEELTLNQYLDIVDQLNKWKVKNILLSGGEPLIRKKDCLGIIQHAASLNFNTTIVTNAYLWNKKICEEFYKAGLTNFTTSLDGAKEETHDRIRRKKGSFKKVINSLKHLNQLKLKDNNPHFSLNCTTVIMKSNFRELINIYPLLRNLGVTNIMYQAVSGDYPELMMSEHEIKEFSDIVKELLKIKKTKGYISNLESYFNLLPQYYKAKIKGKAFRLGGCLAAYNSLIITPEGGIDICGFGPYNITLKDMKIKELWHSKEFQECRKRVKQCNRQCMYLCYKKSNVKDLIKNLIR
ncbi:MAG: radical SAM protein [Nanoarchaeota archaeon]|nr:radical SAM protein [Nanoarchaeota archaeon]